VTQWDLSPLLRELYGDVKRSDRWEISKLEELKVKVKHHFFSFFLLLLPALHWAENITPSIPNLLQSFT
jgi:hypothetical protein